MRYIKIYEEYSEELYKRISNEYTLEKLGVLTELESIADDIISKIGNEKTLNYKFDYKGKNIKVKIEIDPTIPELGKLAGSIFSSKSTIYLRSVNKETLIHELKHLFYQLQNNQHRGYKNILSKSFRMIRNKYESKLKNPNLLEILFYLMEPDEFEAQYNGLYYEVRNEIEKIDTLPFKLSKKSVINDIVKSNDMYHVFYSFSQYQFDVRNWFNDESDIKPFFNDLYHSIKFLSKPNIFSAILFGFTNRNAKDINTNKAIKEFNNVVNNQVQKNYKKLMRLYSLF
jgi:hypothetical protein